ncbi:MAG: PilN domain-containing protein [Methylococcales bacterium]
MARINLLPWHEVLRRQKQRNFFLAMVGSVGIALLILFMIHVCVAGRIEQQDRRNRYLELKIAALDKQIQKIQSVEGSKRKFLAKIAVIQQLQESRTEVVHLFEEMATTVPDGVFLTKMTQKGRTLSFEGKARSNAKVSAYMRNLEFSRWMSDPDLTIIETDGQAKQGRVSLFKLKVSQKKKDQGKTGSKS